VRFPAENEGKYMDVDRLFKTVTTLPYLDHLANDVMPDID